MHDLPDNFVHLTGVIKRDAEARRVREGLHIMDFTIVVGAEEGRRGTYIDCEAYGPAIEATEGYVEEGELVTIEGHFGFRTWTDPNGVRRSGRVIIVDEIDCEEEYVD